MNDAASEVRTQVSEVEWHLRGISPRVTGWWRYMVGTT